MSDAAGPADPASRPPSLLGRFPIYYGWVVVMVAFTTMAIGVTIRTSFSLLYPPILAEFGWDRGITAGIFSVGFLASMLMTPFFGAWINRWGPGSLFGTGAVLVSAGLILTTYADTQFLLFLALGVGVVGGAVSLAYVGHSYLLPFWFVRKRGLAIGLAFSGVGAGAILILPWMQSIIDADGWREACWAMALLCICVVLPLNLLLQRRRPEDLGLQPDGDGRAGRATRTPVDNVVDPAWANRNWSVKSAAGTARFWWLIIGYFFAMHAWYTVLVHQTKYLGEIGFSDQVAAYALGMVGLMGVGGQIGLGALSDRIGREAAWTIALMGFAVCYVLLLVMKGAPSPALLWAMVAVQGLFGYGMGAVYPSLVAELFHGPRFSQIYGACAAFSGAGSAFGPWISGELYDWTGSYDLSWIVALAACFISVIAMWLAAPRKVRLVAGQAAKRAAKRAMPPAAS